MAESGCLSYGTLNNRPPFCTNGSLRNSEISTAVFLWSFSVYVFLHHPGRPHDLQINISLYTSHFHCRCVKPI